MIGRGLAIRRNGTAWQLTVAIDKEHKACTKGRMSEGGAETFRIGC